MGSERLTGSALDIGLRVAAELTDAGVPYALGGALSLGANGLVRATSDIDVNVFVEPAGLGAVFDVLAKMGATLDRDHARAAAAADGMFIAWLGPWRLDIFTPSIDFSWEAAKTVFTVDYDGQHVSFLSGEALAVFKLLFFRTKDLGDLEQLVALRPDLDRGYIRAKVVEMMGETDPRVAAWDEICRLSAVTGE